LDSFVESVALGAEKGAVTGGCILGVPGMIIGGLVGTVLGAIHGLIVKPLTDN